MKPNEPPIGAQPGRRIRAARLLLASLLVTLAVWSVFSWPLPRHLASGIPSSSQNIEKDGVRGMIAGDHLQIAYFYWLFSDMVVGETPWFHNLYEFNSGDDSERYEPGTYNIPFSILYTIFALFGSHALAWNLTGIVVLWGTYLLTWVLLNRYTSHRLLAAVMALVSITLPFEWMSLLGGSPIGFSVIWIPMLALGLDIAVRRGAPGGGLLAAVALYGAHQSDSHAFYFGMLMTPVWCVIVYAFSKHLLWRDPRAWRAMARGLLPVVVVGTALAASAMLTKHIVFEGTAVAAGREIHEVVAFTPRAKGLWGWRLSGKDSHAYLGLTLPVVILAALALHAWRWRQGKANGRSLVTAATITALAALIVMASLGPNGPLNGWLYSMARRWLPGYDMVRQAGKLYCLLPTLLAVAATLALDGARGRRRLPGWLVLTVAFVFIGEYSAQVRATVCLLDHRQGAYEAVAREADRRGEIPRALVLPIWPGDSAWASLYQYYASLYRIRMVNGYRPIVPRGYHENVFEKLGPANIGVLPDPVLDGLLSRGIRSVILHEDAFPEKVSPFPVGFTLQRLLAHPRLRRLAQDQSIWAFEILATPQEPSAPQAEGCHAFFPTLHWDIEWLNNTNCTASESTEAAGGIYLTMARDDATIVFPEFGHWQAPEARLGLRVRGHGRLRIDAAFDDGQRTVTDLPIASPDWLWVDSPLAWTETSQRVKPALSLLAGSIDLDLALFMSGEWTGMQPGETVTWPACIFFHAGYTDTSRSSVKVRAAYEPDDAIFYGPKLPLQPGRYEIDIDIDIVTDDIPRQELGHIYVEHHGLRSEVVPVTTRGKTRLAYEQTLNLPMRMVFQYTRNRDLEILTVSIRRLR